MAGARESPFDLSTCARPNILSLQPYRCARDDYKDDGTNILLDANENAYGPSLALDPKGKLAQRGSNGQTNGETAAGGDGIEASELDLKGLNRYPDPSVVAPTRLRTNTANNCTIYRHQIELKTHLCALRQNPNQSPPLDPANLFVGVGSDEAIDNILRAFCRSGIDKILTCPPTYGMYTVSACVNDVQVEHVPLDASNNFALDVSAISARLDADARLSSPADGRIKVVYLCTPGNPTGALLPPSDIEPLLNHETYNGLIVLDEAYIDFAPDHSSLASWVTRYPNLVVMQTLSKCFGLAGIRLGAAFAAPPVARLLNNLKAPYNVSSVTSELAVRALSDPRHLAVMRANRARILEQRDRLRAALPAIPGVGRFRGGFDSNFLLVEMCDGPGPGARPDNRVAMHVYEALAEARGVVVRFRGKEHGCEGCLRITVGTATEVDRCLAELRSVLQDAFAGATDRGVGATRNGPAEHSKEVEASGAVP